MFQTPKQPDASMSNVLKNITGVLVGICIFGVSLWIGYHAECEA